MELLLFILVAYGISNIVVFGSIFESFRDFWKDLSPNFFGKLFGCMMCFPTWAGFFLSIFFFSPTMYYGLADFGFGNEYTSWFFDGILASGTTWVLHTFQEMMERAFPEE